MSAERLRGRDRLGKGGRSMLLILGGGLFLILFGAFLGQNAALAIVLGRYGASSLPRIYVANAVGLAVISYLTTRLVARFRLRRVLAGAFVLGAVAVEAIRWAYARGFWWAPGGLYVTAFALTDLSVALFWSLANRVYDTRDAKRLFPLVGAAGTLGAAASGFFARAGGAWAPAVVLLDVWAVLLVGCAVWSRVSARRSREVIADGAGPDADDAPARRAPRDSRLATDRPLRWSIGLGLVCVVTVTLFGRYLYGRALSEAYPDAEKLAAVNGLLIGVGSLLTLLVQLLVTSRLLARFGVGAAGFVYPALMLAAFGALHARFGLPAAVFCFFGITTLRRGVQGVVENVLYTPFPPRAAARALVFMTAIGMPAGMLCAGAGLELFKEAPAEYAAAAGLIAAGGLLAAAVWRARAYREALRNRLLKGGSDVRVRFGALLDESNATVESILKEGLSPDAPDLLDRLRTVVRAGERAEGRPGAGGASWDDQGPLARVIDARLRESYRLHAALKRLPAVAGRRELEELWRGALRHRLSENVAVILTALRAGTRQPDFDRISLRVLDADRRVRAAAVEILDSVCPESLRPLVVPLLEEEGLSEGERAARRRYGDGPVTDPVAALFEIPDDWVRACTAYAVAHLDPSPYLPQLRAGKDAADRCLAFACSYALARL